MQVTNCVLVAFSIGYWDANRQDRKVSQEVAARHDVKNERMCRLRKSLLPPSAVMDKLFAVMRAARTFHYENTHAWMHDGPRMLPTQNFDTYMSQMRSYRAQFEEAVLNFISQYEDLKIAAKDVLGTLFAESDYPDKGTLRRRYSFDFVVQPMPATDALLGLGLASEDAEECRRKLEAEMAATFQQANRKMWEELYSRLAKLHSKLSDDKAYVRQETLEAVQNLATLLPRMNITNDERLNQLATRLQSALKDLSAETVKTNIQVRQDAAAEARLVFNVMDSFMNPSASRMNRVAA
jgi:hypothetical protein